MVTVAFKSSRGFASHQLKELTIVGFRAQKNYSWNTQCYPWTIRCNNCSFQINQRVGRCFAFHQLSEWTTVVFRASKCSQFTFPFLIFVFIVFSVSYIEFVGNTFTKTLQNLCCQTELTFIVESFSIGKIWNFQQIHVRSLDCQIIL